MKFFDRIKDHDLVKEIDRSVKIKFNFAWMDDVINYEDRFGVQKTVFAGLFLKKPDAIQAV